MDHKLAADPAVVASTVQDKPEDNPVFRLDTYMDTKGRQILAKVAMPPPGTIGIPTVYEYTYIYSHPQPLPTPMGNIPLEVEVVLDGVNTIHEAFSVLKEQVTAKVPALLKMRVQQIQADITEKVTRARLTQGGNLPPAAFSKG
jgi:hypothetical protein